MVPEEYAENARALGRVFRLICLRILACAKVASRSDFSPGVGGVVLFCDRKATECDKKTIVRSNQRDGSNHRQSFRGAPSRARSPHESEKEEEGPWGATFVGDGVSGTTMLRGRRCFPRREERFIGGNGGHGETEERRSCEPDRLGGGEVSRRSGALPNWRIRDES